MMKLVRMVLGAIILFLDRVFTPKGLVRSEAAQKKVNEELKSLSIYQLVACPFCVKVRRELKRLSLEIELKDILDAKNHDELMQGGKIDQVPCLKITDANGAVQFRYESDEIIAYLRNRFQAVSL